MSIFRIAFILLFVTIDGFAFPLLERNITQGDVRVPVILVQFEDVKFANEDAKSYYTDFLNKEGFNEDDFIGSVSDYFVYNSMGKFRPSFDVLGLVTLPNARMYYDTISEIETNNLAFRLAIDSLLSQNIDFSMYDNDGDNIIEFFFRDICG